MSTGDIVAMAACVLLAGLVGVGIGRETHTVDLPGCRNRLLAAELTQRANELLMARCLDVDEALELCETDQATAASILADYDAQVQELLRSVTALEDAAGMSRKSGDP